MGRYGQWHPCGWVKMSDLLIKTLFLNKSRTIHESHARCPPNAFLGLFLISAPQRCLYVRVEDPPLASLVPTRKRGGTVRKYHAEGVRLRSEFTAHCIQQSMERTFFSNRSTYNDMKDQTMKINELVQNNNLSFLRDR